MGPPTIKRHRLFLIMDQGSEGFRNRNVEQLYQKYLEKAIGRASLSKNSIANGQ